MYSLYIIEITSVLYPLLCLLTSETYRTCTLGGTGHREIWYLVLLTAVNIPIDDTLKQSLGISTVFLLEHKQNKVE